MSSSSNRVPPQYGLTPTGLQRIEAHIDAFDEDAIAVIVFEQSVIEAARAMRLGDADELADEMDAAKMRI